MGWKEQAKIAGYTDEEISNMAIQRVKELKQIYSGTPVLKANFDRSSAYSTSTYADAAAVRSALENGTKSDSNRAILAQNSLAFYATNPLYARVINYFAKMFVWRYKVIPHALEGVKYKQKPYEEIYQKMISIVDGMALPINFDAIMTRLYVEGCAYFTTVAEEADQTLTTILLDGKYCRVTGQTQYGTPMIAFDYSYFTSLGLNAENLQLALEQYPEEMQSQYNAYLSDANLRWQNLDARFSSALRLNEKGIPVYFYDKAAIMNYENYNDNELERNENKLKFLISHKIPIYQDQLILDPKEVNVIHKGLAKIVDSGGRTRLITTYGDVELHKMGDDNQESEILLDSYNSMFNNVGLNHVLFTGDSVTALEYSVIMDQNTIWEFVEQLVVFYNLAINNWFDFGDYEAHITMLHISPYTYDTDLTRYKDSATLGVGKLDYLIASGIKQTTITDQLIAEQHLQLDQIQPLKTSYTQTDNSADGKTTSSDKTSAKASESSDVEVNDGNTSEEVNDGNTSEEANEED